MTDPQTPSRSPGFEGMDAKWNGLPVDACPYKPGPQRIAWVTGWYIAECTKEDQTNAK